MRLSDTNLQSAAFVMGLEVIVSAGHILGLTYEAIAGVKVRRAERQAISCCLLKERPKQDKVAKSMSINTSVADNVCENKS